ncbi:MAG: hypothetical protein M5T61_13525 [Acidimicrobiia bacterium]|nr:hypothetical protein [Acidimicrobiia bacterium]
MSTIPNARPVSAPRLGTLVRCPECHSTELEVVLDGCNVNFYCASCIRCWHIELNRVVRIDPATCYGCAHVNECSARFASDHRAEIESSPVGA